MLNLDDQTYSKIQQHSAKGDDYAEQGHSNRALAEYEAALALLPAPKDQWDAWTWLQVAIGDLWFLNQEWHRSLEAFQTAYRGPEGQENPFIQLRLGQNALELGDEDTATEHLLRAYMLEGSQVFEDEAPKYLAFLKSKAAHIQ